MSATVIELIISELGPVESVLSVDKCAFAYFSKFTEIQQEDTDTISYVDFSIARNGSKLELYGKNFSGTSELILPQLIHKNNLLEFDELFKTMVSMVHNHYVKRDNTSVDLVKKFLATSPDASNEREFMDLWAKFYKSECQSECSRCAVINSAMYNVHGC
jgi:hypothetical protein